MERPSRSGRSKTDNTGHEATTNNPSHRRLGTGRRGGGSTQSTVPVLPPQEPAQIDPPPLRIQQYLPPQQPASNEPTMQPQPGQAVHVRPRRGRSGSTHEPVLNSPLPPPPSPQDAPRLCRGTLLRHCFRLLARACTLLDILPTLHRRPTHHPCCVPSHLRPCWITAKCPRLPMPPRDLPSLKMFKRGSQERGVLRPSLLPRRQARAAHPEGTSLP